MSTETIRVGVIGAGANTTSKHIPGLQAQAGVEIVSVCNRSRGSSERVAQQFNIPTVYEHWWELIAAPDTNAIVIGTWPYMHEPITVAALKAGKHVLCEARMSRNVAEARSMLAASVANPHLTAQIVPSPYSLGVDRTIQRLIKEGFLGDLLAIDIRAGGGPFLNPDTPLHWRQDFDLSGYNIMSMGIWYEALLRWVGEATSVMAMGKSFVKMRLDTQTGTKRPAQVPEHVTIIAELACGAQANITVSAVSGLGDPDGAWLFGSAGTLRFVGGKLYGAKRGDSALAEIPIPEAERGGWRVEEEFVNAIRGLEPITHTSFGDGLKYMIFTEAVTRSMVEGKKISLATL
ncbi:MAG: Gfo/Idh/MocA family oxidoreductase [Caldilineaceae bacterium]